MSLPSKANLTGLRLKHVVSPGVMTLNMVAVALWTVGVFAALYAGYLKPELRVTASTLSSIVNGLATILMFVFIDPQMSMMTDDVMEGRVSESMFRRALIWLVGSRFAGMLIAQLLLVPSASLMRMTHHLLDNGLVAQGAWPHPSELLHSEFRRRAAEILQGHFAYNGTEVREMPEEA